MLATALGGGVLLALKFGSHAEVTPTPNIPLEADNTETKAPSKRNNEKGVKATAITAIAHSKTTAQSAAVPSGESTPPKQPTVSRSHVDGPTVVTDHSANDRPDAPKSSAPETAPSPTRIAVTGIPAKGERPVVMADGIRLDYMAKPSGTRWIALHVSNKTRRALPDQSVVQEVYDALRAIPGATTFFVNGTYQVTMAGGTSGFGTFSSGEAGEMCFYSADSKGIAELAMKAIGKLANVQSPRLCSAQDTDIGNGVTYKSALKESGIDIEVTL